MGTNLCKKNDKCRGGKCKQIIVVALFGPIIKIMKKLVAGEAQIMVR
jgi:hypothetical protein